MSSIVAAPFGLFLPYSSLFNVPKKQTTKRREAQHYWNEAISPSRPAPPASDAPYLGPISPWFDDEAPALSESEDDTTGPNQRTFGGRNLKTFARIRQIAFRAFIPKPGSRKSATVIATELVSRQKTHLGDEKNGEGGPGFNIFTSWRIKSKSVHVRVKKLTTLMPRRISSKSPPDQIPKTWEEYHRHYASEQIDINDPPLPPTETNPDEPSPFEAQCYSPPLAANEPIRQLVINRLGFFEKSAFDASEEATARARERTELAEKLEQAGEEPKSLHQSWYRRSTGDSLDIADNLLPETLEQHPVFRKIVRQCREIFNTSISGISIMTEDRQIFLAESGLDGLREATREFTVCAHTVLSGRKGFTILDTHKDWRFAKSPLVTHFNARFYSGVPLLAPTLDGTAASDAAACPLGTLCVVDDKPREEFGIEERKKLVYMAEYARREIEEWFRAKMSQKIQRLDGSHKTFVEKETELEEDGTMEPVIETLNENRVEPSSPGQKNWTDKRISIKNSFFRSRSSTSLVTSSSPGNSVCKSIESTARETPSIFDDMSAVVKPKMQKVFDLATRLVGDTLSLSLVYIVAVAPLGDSIGLGQTLIISAHGLPTPSPVLDAGLHLRVLRSAEGGLLYQNPTAQEAQDAALIINESNSYASAIMVRIGPAPVGNVGGFVIAGFTVDPKRVFGGEDVEYMKQFANELTRSTKKLKL